MIRKMYRLVKSEYRKANKFINFLSVLNLKEAWIVMKRMEKDSTNSVILHPKELENEIKVRNHHIDKSVLYYVLYKKYHLPPKSSYLVKNATVVDLGSNIGLTIAHIKSIYPNVRVIGYEMDVDNYELAKWNTQHYKQVDLVNKAIWIENKIVKYNKGLDFDAYSIGDQGIDKYDSEVQAITLRELIKEHSINKINYLKMDIEGAEKNILKNSDLDWLDIVNSINIELHLDENESIDEYIEILKNHNFTAWKDEKFQICIMAIKNSL